MPPYTVDMDPNSWPIGRPSWLSRPHSHASSTRWPFDAPSDERERREAPGEAACAAETGRPLLLSSRPLNQTYGASPNGQHAALHNAERETRCAGSLTALELVHAERRWRMHGESKTTPAEAAPSLLLGRKASFLRLVRGRLAANSADPCSATLSCLFSTPRTRP